MTRANHNFMQKTGSFIDHISWLAALLAGTLMLIVALFMSYEAFSRHFLDSPTSWVFAVSILVFMWFIFPPSFNFENVDGRVCILLFPRPCQGPSAG